MKLSIRWLVASIGIFCLASPATGQRITRHSGFWISGGGDLGYAAVDCRVCNSDAVVGPAAALQVGGSPSRSALLGMEFSYWRSVADTTAQEYVLVMAVVRYYPSQNIPLFLSGGFGVGRYGEERVSPTGPSWALSANGFTLQFSGGYELKLSERVSFCPMVRFLAVRGHNAKVNQIGESRDMEGNWLRLGAHFTWR